MYSEFKLLQLVKKIYIQSLDTSWFVLLICEELTASQEAQPEKDTHVQNHVQMLYLHKNVEAHGSLGHFLSVGL